MLYKQDFKFGGPIEPRLFYNREKEIKFLSNQLLQLRKGIRHNYALVGPRRIGKSSVLVLLERKLKRKNLIPILIDCEGREITRERELSLDLFLNSWGSLILDRYFEHIGLGEKIKVKLSSLLVEAKDKIVLTLSELLGRLRAMEMKTITDYLTFRIEFEKTTMKERPSAQQLIKLFDDTVGLAEKVGNEKNLYWIIMLDEFQVMGKFTKPFDFLSAFRRHLEHQKRIAYLLSGSNIGMMENILLKRPFGGHIPIEWINPFDQNTATGFLQERFRGLNRIIMDDAVKEIVSFTHGHPAYLNWLGEQCCREVVKGDEVKLDIVKKLEEKMFSYEGLAHVFEDDLRKISPKKGKVFQTFVEMCAHGLNSPSRISENVPRSSPSEIITYLRRLEFRGFLRRIGEGNYVVVDPVLKNYIKEKIHTN